MVSWWVVNLSKMTKEKKLVLKLCVNVESLTHTTSFEDLGTTEDEWNSFTKEEQDRILYEYLDELPEHPHWLIDKYEIK